MKEGVDIDYITTTHQLAKELLSRPDGFIAATNGEEEYVIESIKRDVKTSDFVELCVNWKLKLRRSGNGEIRR